MPTQRLNLTQKATAAADGTATFQFPAPPTDLVWHGTLVCNTAPSAALFIATVGGSQWSSWNGPAVGGPVQALPGEVVKIIASGLTAGTAYALGWIGRSDPLSQTVPSYPDTNAAPATQLVGGGVPSAVAGAVYLVGGLTYVHNKNSGAATTALLGPPGAGNVYRLHRAVYDMAATFAEILGDLTQNEYSRAAASGVDNLEGLCVSEALDFLTSGGAGDVWLYYDLIQKPTLAVPAAIGVQQVVSAQGNGTIAVTLTGVTPGNQIIVLFGNGSNPPGGFATIATTAGTTSAWNLANRTNNGSTCQAQIWSALAQTSTVTVTVTVPTPTGSGQISAIEVAKLNGTADASTVNSGGGVSSFPATAITPGAFNDLAVVALGTNTGSITSGPVGWVRDGTTGSGGDGALGAHLLPSGSSALTPTFTGGSAGNFAIVAATFPSL